MGELGRVIAERVIGEVTLRKTGPIGLQRARENLPSIERSIADLASEPDPAPGDSAIVVAAGPSLHRRDTARRILEAGYRGAVVAADGALGYCLRHGLVPHYVVTVDPHESRILRWFGDPDLERRAPDDYFRRQDLDPHFGRDELRWNRELIELVDAHAGAIRLIASTSAAPLVARRCREAGMRIYWWNPIYDDPDDPGGYTRRIYELTRLPCMATGGNVGSSAWVFATAALKKRRVALAGMDLGYHPETPYPNTQYYGRLKELFGDQMENAYIRVHNPHLGEIWFTDPTYYWYRECFLEMAARSGATTYNCTEGGILFGEGIRFVPLGAFFSDLRNGATQPMARGGVSCG